MTTHPQVCYNGNNFLGTVKKTKRDKFQRENLNKSKDVCSFSVNTTNDACVLDPMSLSGRWKKKPRQPNKALATCLDTTVCDYLTACGTRSCGNKIAASALNECFLNI